ncbi:hypothetical protein BBIA_0916 [Bifidobacterium biavatii DSM 23969]|uniref:Uncharacterized protein n=1 Tax=Bifidobacterium biavatii DSM 23969 TaxID=1437608 RepID=A0A087A142_9BIFI|nr:hypothetical protein BBIA_0916 [Bifidobacterium biavatii DSM 23969]
MSIPDFQHFYSEISSCLFRIFGTDIPKFRDSYSELLQLGRWWGSSPHARTLAEWNDWLILAAFEHVRSGNGGGSRGCDVICIWDETDERNGHDRCK